MTLAAGVVAILGIIIVFGGGGGDDDSLVAEPTVAVTTPTSGPTLPAHTPGVPPESPPQVAGEEVTTESGLVYIDFSPGSGEESVDLDTVAVNYSGWLQETGELFDSSLSRATAFQVVIDIGQVIAGWDEGLVGIAEGGKRRLIIPPDLAYADVGAGETIPPNATLIFDVELVDILVPSGAAENSE